MCDLQTDDEIAAPRRCITDFVDELTVALTNARVYSKDHPRVRSSIASLLQCVQYVAQEGGANPVVIGSAGGILIYERKALLRVSLSSARVIEALTECCAGALSIGRHAGEQDVVALIEVMAAPKKGFAGIEEANAELIRRGSRFIRFLPEYDAAVSGVPGSDGLLPDDADEDDPRPGSLAFDVPVALYQQTVALLQDSAARVCHGGIIDLDIAKGYVEKILKRLAQDAAAMMSLARYERYDAYTFGHSIRVCFLALGFARTLVANEELLLRIGLASLLHDIGKARVPFEVLHSTTRLTPEERVEMNKHTTHGGEILLGLPKTDPLAVATAFGHHKTLSGGGYPSTLHTSRQSIGTQIVKICDVFEALTAVRPYKPRMSPVRAYRVMISMRDDFNPALLRRFIQVTGVYPVGSLVKLSTGETARVLRQSADPLAPVIRVEVDDRGTSLDHASKLVQDLSKVHDRERPSVVELIDDPA